MENVVVIQGTARNPLGEMKVHARSDEGARENGPGAPGNLMPPSPNSIPMNEWLEVR